MGPCLEYGLGLNVEETLSSVQEKSSTAEDLGFDYVWMSDLPDQLYAPVVASAVAARTSKIRVGLGLISVLLHSPRHVAMSMTALSDAYGDRFDLCIGVGDARQLNRVGIDLNRVNNIVSLVLEARRKIVSDLHRSGVKARVWLGAQGPKMLAAAKAFDGVLLNYSKPEMIEWAVAQGHLRHKKRLRIGIFSPSYVHFSSHPNLLMLAKISSATVALGASKAVLRRFGLDKELSQARKIADTSFNLKQILDLLPDRIVDDFSVTMTAENLSSYLATVKRLKVSHVVFAYPQNYSVETVRELGRALDLAA